MRTIIKSLFIWVAAPTTPIFLLVAFVAGATSRESAWKNLHDLVGYALWWGIIGWLLFALFFTLCLTLPFDPKIALFCAGCCAGVLAIMIIETLLYNRTLSTSFAAVGLFYGGVVCALPHTAFVEPREDLSFEENPGE